MSFAFASAQDIVRSRQKDTSIELLLQNDLRQLVQYLKGVRFLHAHAAKLDVAASTLYLSLTTLLGTRTLGEEYTDLIYLTDDRQLPSWARKAGWVLCSSLGPLLLGKYLRKQRAKWLETLDEGSLLHSALSACNTATLVTLNLTLFYFAGSYYDLSKRLFGLRYAFGHYVNPLEQQGSYEFLGLLMIVKTLGQLINKLRARYMLQNAPLQEHNPVDLEDPEVLPFIPSEARDCTLCLETVKDPTITLCGHLFCWSCISEWCRESGECPLCRQKCAEQNLLVLQS